MRFETNAIGYSEYSVLPVLQFSPSYENVVSSQGVCQKSINGSQQLLSRCSIRDLVICWTYGFNKSPTSSDCLRFDISQYLGSAVAKLMSGSNLQNCEECQCGHRIFISVGVCIRTMRSHRLLRVFIRWVSQYI